MLCVEWRRQDRRTWIIGPRLRVMQEYAACRREEWKEKKGTATVMRVVYAKKINNF